MSEFSEKAKTIGVIGQRTRDKVSEGKAHPDSGRPFKSVTDQNGATVTEHSSAGRAPGVSDRQDVEIRPTAIKLKIGVQ